MKSYKSFLLGVLVTVLASTLFWTGTVYASTGCFTDTNGYWAETFICWLKDNSISSGYGDGSYKPDNNITRGEMSVFLQKVFNLADSSAQTKANTAETNAKTYADSSAQTKANTAETNAKTYADTLHTGDILITMGPDDWFQNRSSPNILTLNKYYTDVQVVNPNTGLGYIIGIPNLPASMFGRALALSGVEICYTASASATLTQFDLYIDTQSIGVGTSFVTPATDATDRIDSACRLYTFSPVTLSGEKIVNIKIHGNWTVAGTSLSLGRATFVLQPTTTSVSPLSKSTTDTEEPVQEFPSSKD